MQANSPSGSKDVCMRQESKVLGMGAKLHTQIKGPRIVSKSLRESQKACMRWELKVLGVDTRIHVGVKGFENVGKSSHKTHEVCVN